MKKLIAAFVAALSLATAAQAVTITGTSSFSPAINVVNPGLQAKAVVLSNTGAQTYVSSALNFDLVNVGDSFTTDLFVVRVLSSAVALDDYIAKAFGYNFALNVGSAGLTGTTYAADSGATTSGVFDVDGPVTIALGGGIGLVVSMSDLLFNTGPLGSFTPGKENGAVASVTFTLATIPLPASALMLLAALGGLGVAARRRTSLAA
jgi:hypothetical protein